MSGSTTGTVKLMLRLEGAVVLAAALAAYNRFGMGWGWFAACFFIPDLSILVYLAGARAGAVAYNAAHSYIGAVACLGAGAVMLSPTWVAAGLVWCAHIGFDRALGYGLKYAQGFGFTHLGRIGRAAKEAPRA